MALAMIKDSGEVFFMYSRAFTFELKLELSMKIPSVSLNGSSFSIRVEPMSPSTAS